MYTPLHKCVVHSNKIQRFKLATCQQNSMKQKLEFLQAGMTRKNARNCLSDRLWIIHLKPVALNTMKCFGNLSISDNIDLISVYRRNKSNLSENVYAI